MRSDIYFMNAAEPPQAYLLVSYFPVLLEKQMKIIITVLGSNLQMNKKKQLSNINKVNRKWTHKFHFKVIIS